MARRMGSRPSTTRLASERRAAAVGGMLVVGFKVEPRIETGDLLAITIEQQGRPPLHEQSAFADPALRGLAPARVVDVGIDVGVKTVLAGVLQVPGAAGLSLRQADADDGFDPLEAVLPGHHQPDRGAVLVEQRLTV